MNTSEPFPQAEDLEKVISLLSVKKEEDLSNDQHLFSLLDIGSLQQLQCYLSAGRYIGFIGEGRTFSPLGKKLRTLTPTEQEAEIARIIVADPIWGTVYFRQKFFGFTFDEDEILATVRQNGMDIAAERISTIGSWIKYLYSLEE